MSQRINAHEARGITEAQARFNQLMESTYIRIRMAAGDGVARVALATQEFGEALPRVVESLANAGFKVALPKTMEEAPQLLIEW